MTCSAVRWLLPLSFFICHFLFLTPAGAQSLTFVELNCENLFDCRHDSLKQDTEYLPDSPRHWTHYRYWKKLNNIAQEVLSCASDGIPDLVALVEVENDSVLTDLTRRSLLRNAGYGYVMTTSPDLRGIDVALLYSPFSFAPVNQASLRIAPPRGKRPTRDILYVAGRIASGDTLHVFVVHAPSRYEGRRASQPYRLLVAQRLSAAIDSVCRLSPQARILVAGDFNDYATDPSLQYLADHGLHNVSSQAQGSHGARGTYRHQGRWGSIDHVLLSTSLLPWFRSAHINDAPFLLEEEPRYGGVRPRRTFTGYRYQPGYSDHLPLIVHFDCSPASVH